MHITNSLLLATSFLFATIPARSEAPYRNAGPANTKLDTAAYAALYYVSSLTGSDSGDGTRLHPWKSIARVSGVSAGPSRRAAILVAEGRYLGATVQMKPFVDLYGGFEVAAWTRDINKHRTVIDGEGLRRAISAASNSRLDGFVVRGGRVRGKGAGLLCDGVSPDISNNVFLQNETLAPENWKPAVMHESANDGGAVAILNGSRAALEHNLIARNTTQCGRGGGISVDGGSSPRILSNVIIENRTGTADPGRSSDGGGISVYDHSNPELTANVIAGNRSAASNDAGGVFIALWSSPVVKGNILVGNWGDDDGGALFIGGQKHHYGTPIDPVPPVSDYLVRVLNNVIAGNDNKSHNAGIGRVAMQSRVEFRDNVMARNIGGLRIQSSGATLSGNRLIDPVAVMNDSKASRELPGAVVIERNILAAKTSYDMDVTAKFNCTEPKFIEDGVQGKVATVKPEWESLTTTLDIVSDRLQPGSMAGRAIRIGRTWTVVLANSSTSIQVWGTLQESPSDFEVLPSYQLSSGSCADKR